MRNLKNPSAFWIHECWNPVQRKLVQNLFGLTDEQMNNFNFLKKLEPKIFGSVRSIVRGAQEPFNPEYTFLPLIPLTSDQMIFPGSDRRREVNKSMTMSMNWMYNWMGQNNYLKAEKVVFGLGAYTAVASKNGLLLSKGYDSELLNPNIQLVSGDKFTAWLGFQQIKEISEKLKIQNPKVLFIGGTGTTGSLIIKLLLRDGFESNRISSLSKRPGKANAFHKDTKVACLINSDFSSEDQLVNYIHRNDIIVIVTSGNPKIKPEFFTNNIKAVVDFTMPRFLIRFADRLNLEKTFYVDGGWAKIPPDMFHYGVDINHPTRRIIYACEAETLIGAFYPQTATMEHDLEGIDLLVEAAEELGVMLAPPQLFSNKTQYPERKKKIII